MASPAAGSYIASGASGEGYDCSSHYLSQQQLALQQQSHLQQLQQMQQYQQQQLMQYQQQVQTIQLYLTVQHATDLKTGKGTVAIDVLVHQLDQFSNYIVFYGTSITLQQYNNLLL